MERAKAVAFLKEVAATNTLIPNWVSLVNDGNSGYYVHIKPEFIELAPLRLIVRIPGKCWR